MKNRHIKELLDGLGTDNLYSFYRAVYKSTACGPSIGFKIRGKWLYNSDLPHDPAEVDQAEALGLSTIIEGSEVELEGGLFICFKPDEFWRAVEAMNKEAEFYWTRDNSQWCTVHTSKGKYICIVRWTTFDDNPEIEGFTPIVTGAPKKYIIKAARRNWSKFFPDFGPPSACYFDRRAQLQFKPFEPIDWIY